MKNITIVVPTMKRDKSAFDYLSTMMDHSHFDMDFCDHKFIFSYQNEKDEVLQYTDKHNFEFIYRDETNELYKPLSKFDKGSYEYWRSHLCIDFIYSMNSAMEKSTSDYFMWLEDDTILTPEFATIFQNDIHDISNYANIGFCCIVFQKNVLRKFIDFIKINYLEDIPLDLMLQHIPSMNEFHPKKCAYHIGVISSRDDSLITRVVEEPFKLSTYPISPVYIILLLIGLIGLIGLYYLFMKRR